MSKKWKILIGVAAAAVLGIVLMGSIRGRDKNAPKVTTAKVEKVDLVSAFGRGQIVNRAVKEGDQVRKGQLLLQIDKAQLAAGVAGREATQAAMGNDLQAARANRSEEHTS